MGPVFGANEVGVVTRSSDIFAFLQEEPWEGTDTGARPEELPLPRLKRRAANLTNGRLLREVVTPGTRLNNAKTEYIVAIESTLRDRARLLDARAASDRYGRLLAEHFVTGFSVRSEILLQVVTAAFGAGVGAVLGSGVGAATLGASVGLIAAKGVVAGIVSVVNKMYPLLVRKIRARAALQSETRLTADHRRARA